MSKSIGWVGLVLTVAILAGGETSQAASTFDGSWSVSVRSKLANCEAGAFYAVRVENGKVSYNGGDMSLSGQVDASGRIHVNINHNGRGASGSGHLSGTKGAGTWRGQRSAIMCSGSWEAQRL